MDKVVGQSFNIKLISCGYMNVHIGVVINCPCQYFQLALRHGNNAQAKVNLAGRKPNEVNQKRYYHGK